MNVEMTTQPRPTRNDRATIEDVAAAAGVSVATVSRALRGLPNVANSTRQRVEAIAEELAYRPDPAASRLATGRSQAIAVAVPVLNGWYFSNVVAGIEAVCTESGFDTVVLGVSSEADRERLAAGTDSIHRRVDGVILVDIALRAAALESMTERGLKIVTVGPQTGLCPSIGIDDVEVGRMATSHLVELGHRRIGLVNGQPEDPLDFVVPLRRTEGYEGVLTEAGITVDPALQVSGNFSIAGGYEAVSELLDSADPPTAVFAMSDEMAFGAIQAARERGLDVPGDLSIVGVDDHDAAVVLDLTTVHQDIADRGARAARLMLTQVTRGDNRATRIDDPIRLVIRGTTAPPR